jgi:hypothetical protein
MDLYAFVDGHRIPANTAAQRAAILKLLVQLGRFCSAIILWSDCDGIAKAIEVLSSTL